MEGLAATVNLDQSSRILAFNRSTELVFGQKDGVFSDDIIQAPLILFEVCSSTL